MLDNRRINRHADYLSDELNIIDYNDTAKTLRSEQKNSRPNDKGLNMALKGRNIAKI